MSQVRAPRACSVKHRERAGPHPTAAGAPGPPGVAGLEGLHLASGERPPASLDGTRLTRCEPRVGDASRPGERWPRLGEPCACSCACP
jgi:hypothetical protein